MKFDMAGKFEQGVADVDPVSAPATIEQEHILVPKVAPAMERISIPKDPSELWLLLVGTGVETLTLTLYFLLEDMGHVASRVEYVDAAHRWYQFATGIVVINGTIQKVSSGLPAGGVIYARRTADTIGAGEVRPLLCSWIYA
ncbi:MAG TPA: hypothetical protein VMW10_04870 [Alphaproteobacteria bacterium]|nr:hypothetical protein [Alphaproteobacteria bacterium]